MFRHIFCYGSLVPALALASAAHAQTKPATSGAVSFHEPEMLRHRSGFKRPRRPHHGVSLRELRR